MVIKKDGNLPVLFAKGENIAEAWENSVGELYKNGLWYERGGRKDKGGLQVDSTMIIEISNPLSDFYHKYMTCGLDDLLEYQMEMLGAKNSWVDPTGKSTKWGYHYNERMTGYPTSNGELNQFEEIFRNLKERPNTRQAQAITWVPERDTHSLDPPCLQSIWLSLVPNEESGNFKLNMNYRFRSRNVMIAAPMNQFGIATLGEYLKRKISKNIEQEIETGRMVDLIDAYHVSSHDQHILSNFMELLAKSKKEGETIKDRSYDKEFSMEIMKESHSRIEQKIIDITKDQLAQKNATPEIFDKEIEKIKQISNEVASINGY